MGASISFEKYLPLIPVIGTSVAVLFDVGYFWGVGINYFTFFSFTEHISFALEALPIAILILVFWVVVDALPPHFDQRKPDQSSSPSTADLSQRVAKLSQRIKTLQTEINSLKSRLRWMHIAIFGVGAAVLLYLAHLSAWRTFTVVCAMLLTTVLKIIAPPRWYTSQVSTLIFLGMISALLVGEFMGATYAAGKKALETVTLKTGDPLSVRIIRSREKGVLFVRPDTDSIQFLLWENIKEVTAKRVISRFD